MSDLNRSQKQKFVLVTKPDEIEAIQRDSFTDPIGGEYKGQWFAYEWSIKAWRARASVRDSDA